MHVHLVGLRHLCRSLSADLQQPNGRRRGLTQGSASPSQLLQAALCLAAYTINLREKKAAVQAGTLKPILALLADESLPVRVAATSVLMSVTVANECKSSAMEANAVRALVPLLDGAMLYELQAREVRSRWKMEGQGRVHREMAQRRRRS